MLSEIKYRRCDWKFGLSAGHGRQSLALTNGLRQVFAMMAFHLWLRIEQIHLRWSTRLKQIDDSLRFRLMSRKLLHVSICSRELLSGLIHQGRQRSSSDGRGAILQEDSTIQNILNLKWVHSGSSRWSAQSSDSE